MSQYVLTLVSPETGAEAKILPERGFNCFSFKPVCGQPHEVFWTPEGFEAGQTRAVAGGFPWLFPFAGRIGGGEYFFGGQKYELTQNDPGGRPNAIHGFVADRAWRVIETGPTRAAAMFQLSSMAPDLLPFWPTDFILTASYELKGNRLCIEFGVVNPTDRVLPCWLGVHPYFRIPLSGRGKEAEHTLTVPAASVWELHEMLPTGYLFPAAGVNGVSQGIPLDQANFDTVFSQLQFDSGWTEARLDQGARRLSVRFNDAFKTCVLFNPRHREAVCIEPYTAVPDAFSLAARGIDGGLTQLPPGGRWRGEIHIELT